MSFFRIVLAATVTAATLLTAVPATAAPTAAPVNAKTKLVKITTPNPVYAQSSFPITVETPANWAGDKGSLSYTRDGKTYKPLSNWTLTKDGKYTFTFPTDATPGWHKFLVTISSPNGKKITQAATNLKTLNPYRPVAPDNANIPETGIVVPATLFGNHPIHGTPAGAGVVRLWDTSTSWNQIEKAPGQFDWSALDKHVAQAEAAGQQIMLVLGGTPAWAAVGSAPGNEFAGPGSSMPMQDPAMFENYVRAVTQRYGARISAYQIWNEVNISEFWRGTPELMADLTARAYPIIKAANPNATVVAASTGSRWVKGFTEFYPEYLAALGQLGWPIDAYSVHLYPQASGTTMDRAYLLGMMHIALDLANAPVKPIWETEINYGITNPGSGQAARTIPAGEIAGYVGRTYMDSLRFGIDRSFWYGWTPDYRLLGIQMHDGLPASGAYTTIRNWVVGATFYGCQTTDHVVQCNFTRGASPFYIVYTEDASAGSITPPAGISTVNRMDGTNAPAGGVVAVDGNPALLN